MLVETEVHCMITPRAKPSSHLSSNRSQEHVLGRLGMGYIGWLIPPTFGRTSTTYLLTLLHSWFQRPHPPNVSSTEAFTNSFHSWVFNSSASIQCGNRNWENWTTSSQFKAVILVPEMINIIAKTTHTHHIYTWLQQWPPHRIICMDVHSWQGCKPLGKAVVLGGRPSSYWMVSRIAGPKNSPPPPSPAGQGLVCPQVTHTEEGKMISSHLGITKIGLTNSTELPAAHLLANRSQHKAWEPLPKPQGAHQAKPHQLPARASFGITVLQVPHSHWILHGFNYFIILILWKAIHKTVTTGISDQHEYLQDPCCVVALCLASTQHKVR